MVTSEGDYTALLTPQHFRKIVFVSLLTSEGVRTSMEFHKQKTTEQGPGKKWLCNPTLLQDFQAAQLWKNREWSTYIISFMKHEHVPL